ncbi:response regulator [Desulfuribacillus alkaliarsenatis]|uniref:Histidine kinase n=1 Tax=Desulfuribacillus alkaliarsenatis TaxID=766136 RepID=A0A1E5G0Z8_9FIRM|nr:response regulator [Desulfuribacillus alkaliarsenatis]OEF96587.1 histidine kinase [Desulfuribacillus alkaliarsenatis]
MLKILVAEDDMVSRKFLHKILSEYGECDLVVDGLEAIEAYMMSMKYKEPYDLICLDIMMPKVDGVKVLKTIRDLEKQHYITEDQQVKIIMTTALGETDMVQQAFDLGSNAYASKPINTEKLIEVMCKLKLI